MDPRVLDSAELQQQLVRLRTCVEAGVTEGKRNVVCGLLESDASLLRDEDLVLELICAEIVCLEENGDVFDLPHFVERHPGLEAPVARLLEVHRSMDGGDLTAGENDSELNHDASTLPRESAKWNSAGGRLPKIPGLELRSKLGEGGMGIVYEAWQTKLQRRVALKTTKQASTSRDYERFRLEAESIANLNHRNIVALYEIGEVEWQPYLIMEYISGRSLASHLNQETLPIEQTCEIAEKIADAMHHAHLQGIVHRDLKPSNILLTEEFEPKIVDFGIAKNVFQSSDTLPLTQTHALLGTPAYMAPEQLDTHTADSSLIDIYAVGAVLYEMLSGRAPFHSGSMLEILEQVRKVEPTPLQKLAPSVPRDLVTLCEKCMRKDASARYASMRDVADELRRFRNGETVLARPVPFVERMYRRVVRRPLVSALATLAFVLAVLGSVGVLWQWSIAERHATRAEAHSELADASFAEVRKLVTRLLNVSGSLSQLPDQDDQQLQLLNEALRSFKAFTDEKGQHPEFLEVLSSLQQRIAFLHQVRHEFAQAESVLADARSTRETLLGFAPESPEHRFGVAALDYREACLYALGKRYDDARKSYRRCVQRCEDILVQHPTHLQTTQMLPIAILNEVVLLDDTPAAKKSRLTDAGTLFAQALSNRDDLDPSSLPASLVQWLATGRGDRPDVPAATVASLAKSGLSTDLADQLLNYSLLFETLSFLDWQLGERENAIQSLRLVRDLQRTLHEQNSTHYSYRFHYLRSSTALGDMLGQAGETAASLRLLEEASENLKALWRHYPQRLAIPELWMQAQVYRCQFMLRAGVVDEIAYIANQVASELNSVKVAEDSGGEANAQLAAHAETLARLLEGHQETLSDSLAIRRSALRIYRELIGLGHASFQDAASDNAFHLSRSYLQLGEMDSSIDALRLGMFPCPDSDHYDLTSHPMCARVARYLALSTLQPKELKTALKYLEESLDASPHDPRLLNHAAWLAVFLGAQESDESEATRVYRTALRRSARACELQPSDADLQHTLATLQLLLGQVSESQGFLEGMQQRVIELDAFDQLVLALGKAKTGDFAGARRWLREASATPVTLSKQPQVNFLADLVEELLP